MHRCVSSGAVVVTIMAMVSRTLTVRATSWPSCLRVLPLPNACMTRGISMVPKTLLDISANMARGTTVLVRQVPVVRLAALTVVVSKTAWTRLAM